MEQLAILNNITSMTMEQQEATAMHFEIVQAAKTAVNSLLDLGRKLKRMRDSGRYKDLGFSSFAEYTEAAVGIKQRQAYNYITVVESLPARLIEENAAAGVTKLALLSKLNPEDREDLTGDTLANITVAELKKLVEERDAMAQQLNLFQQEEQVEAVAEVEAEPIDADTIRRQAVEETRQQMAAEFAEEKAKLEAAHAAAINEATLKAEKAAAAELRKAKDDAKQKAQEETAKQVAKSSAMTGTEINAEDGYIPDFKAAVAATNMLNRKAGQTDGFVCKSSAGRVVRLIQNYDSSIYTQEPEELPAQWRFVWSTDPAKAQPFIALSTSPYAKGDCCLNAAGQPRRSTLDNNVFDPDTSPQYWEDP